MLVKFSAFHGAAAVLCVAAMIAVQAHGDEKQEFVLEDQHLATACGPIASFCALKSVGCDVTLEEMVQECKWVEGELTTLQTILTGLNRQPGIDATAVRLSPDQLIQFLSEGKHSAILAVARFGPEIDHVLCVSNSSGPAVKVIDYPQMGRFIHKDDLAEMWDGEAILVSSMPVSRLKYFTKAIVPGAILAFLVILLVSRGLPGIRRNSVNATEGVQ